MSLRRVLRLRCPPPHSPIEAHPNPVSQIQEIQLPGRRSGTTVTAQPRRARVPPAGRRHLSLRIDAGRWRVSHALEVSSLQRGLTRSLHLRCGSSFEDGVSTNASILTLVRRSN